MFLVTFNFDFLTSNLPPPTRVYGHWSCLVLRPDWGISQQKNVRLFIDNAILETHLTNTKRQRLYSSVGP